MAIPKQVQQRSEEVEKMYRQEAQPAEQPQATQSEDDAQQDENEPLQAEDTVEVVESSEDDDTIVEIQRPDDVAKQLSELRKQVEQSDQRFKTLQGMQQRTEQENQRLQMLLSQMSEQPQKEPEQAPKAADPGEAKDREDFGEDFVEMVNRAIDRRLTKLEERLSKTEGVAKESYEGVRMTRQERFDAELSQKVPGWRSIDSSPEFLEWLNQSTTRVAIVREAMANYDSTAIAEIFELYEKLTGTGQETPSSEPAGKKLEKKVAPSKGRTSKPSGSEEKKVWTKTEIAQVFRDRRRFSQKEFERLQKDIFNAQQEGRVDYTR